MKTILKFAALATLSVAVLAIILSGCNKSGEQASIEGTWEYVYDPETEGEPTEITSYSFLSDGKMTWSYTIEDPEYTDGDTISGKGVWKTEGENLVFSIKYEEGDEIESDEFSATFAISGDVLTLKDEDGEREMKRVNK